MHLLISLVKKLFWNFIKNLTIINGLKQKKYILLSIFSKFVNLNMQSFKGKDHMNK